MEDFNSLLSNLHQLILQNAPETLDLSATSSFMNHMAPLNSDEIRRLESAPSRSDFISTLSEMRPVMTRGLEQMEV